MPPSAAAPAAATPLPFLGGFIKQTRIAYPLTVGEWTADGDKTMEPGAGAAIRYVREGEAGWIDLIVYPVGIITPERFAQMARMERDSLASTYPGSGIGKLHRFTFRLASAQGKPETKEGWSVDLELEVGGTPLSSGMALLSTDLHLVKARYSAPKAALSRRKLRKALEGFLAGAAPQLSIASTGECWHPWPVERLADGEPDP